jgi:hypothetical protein
VKRAAIVAALALLLVGCATSRQKWERANAERIRLICLEADSSATGEGK